MAASLAAAFAFLDAEFLFLDAPRNFVEQHGQWMPSHTNAHAQWMQNLRPSL
ncbi:MAG: hypothetical protein MPK75_01045 [Alphaproteobacteria bacterium]|nr:hypothetical protein [Alphaproteobacteria bacterium]